MKFLRFGAGTLSRRRFLAGLGASALAVPFLRGLPSALAATTEPILVLLFTPNGVVRHLFGADPAPTGMALRSWCMPLQPYQDQVTVINGLENKAAGSGTHGPGMKTLWTGVAASGDEGFASAQSIDQRIADELKPNTRFRTLEFRARSPQDYMGASGLNRMIYSATGAPLDPREDPQTAVDEIFLGLGANLAPGMVSERTKQRQALFTQLHEELNELTPRLIAEDRRQLEALREAWNSIGKQTETLSLPTAACARPQVRGVTDYAMLVKTQLDILAMALACGLTRIASFQFSQARSPWVPDFLGVPVDFHDGISHQVPQAQGLGPGGYAMPDPDHPTPEQLANFQVPIERATTVNVWLASQIAYLAAQLQASVGANAEPLLKSSLLCWGNELDNGNSHNHSNMPLVLIGGAAGRIKTGQLVSYPVLSPNAQAGTGARSHNDLLTTVGQVMGANIQSFGDAALNRGALSEILV